MTAESNPATTDEPQELQRAENASPIELLTSLLQEAEHEHRGRPAADWPRWYAAFVSERQLGASIERAQVFADQYTRGEPT